MRLIDAPTTDLTVEIYAAPEEIWPLITDIDLPSRFSDEYLGGEWIERPAGLGATFRGRSHHERIGEWETTSTVVVFEPNRAFGWAVSSVEQPAAVWTFLIEPRERGASLTYRMQLGPGPSGLSAAIERRPDREDDIIQRRIDEQRIQMRKVVEGIKELVEKR